MPVQLEFAKGHGTMNDFVVLSDPDGSFDPSPAQVRFLCDRRAGVGADGVLRAVPARFIEGWAGKPELWFMDYRNADGSLAEMCGNGVRVFLVFLKAAGLVPADVESVTIGTRAGVRIGTYLPAGGVRVWMGRPAVEEPAVEVSVGSHTWRARAVDVGNPHAVSVVDADRLRSLDLTRMPAWSPSDAFANGVNLEFITPVGANELRMRVFERGVGETFSCGTGTVAAASAFAADHGETEAEYVVHVPGGSVRVELAGGDAYLSGPAEIVYHGTIVVPEEEHRG
ncbi:diaminopimelate epimerase [Propioniciclava tarda]|uniref:Diaminopimelate epimerase n=1 Tax=Propioniciclava tarda TaxID=433330 RepID=A0A4Q9KNC2_PROTD|nr:diaminopimelate epimerase [Propioniciclava tarda]TBT96043.1 diaminopimelate epimerase [Propioniciclava tarda]SMO43549.1 diaminopimelate epimerase [Propioniciclava tarda]HOA88043.1 diaminopimelate epimerase [Propioniciclava tarda]HQA30517.1 diaminopimelate epimerase [Propioniciclava tarda]HQD59697.1 diaminopimelate epimerase [Propioniciclava tarda]